MTNILLLARSGNVGAFTVVTDADWLDQILPALGATPIDLTGIAFSANMRAAAGGNDVYLQLSTANGTLVNGGVTGKLSFNVPVTTMAALLPGNYVIDVLATADGHTINLYQSGPATVTVDEGIT
jgi:hypothetical protein